MGRFNINTVSNGTRISDMGAGETFNFTYSTKGNNGLCLRLADSKRGKNRFANLESGKVLTAGASDRGYPVDVDVAILED